VLDTISDLLIGVVAPVEWHVSASYPLYCAEAHDKWYMYPPPYQGSYATPWLWVDGKSRGYSYNQWQGYVMDALRVPSDVGLTHIGTYYDTITRNGQVEVECYNSGSDSINAKIEFAITEDSIYYNAPNGDQWHSHTCRDYVPNASGTTVVLPAGATDTVTLSYSLNAAWDETRVKLVLYLQNTTPQSDSSEPCYQGIAANVMDYTGIAEPSKRYSTGDIRVQVGPNPCRAGCEFVLSGAAARDARIDIYTPDGRLVSNVQTAGNRATWNRNGVSRGVYLYRVVAGAAAAEGKLVVTD
jgi:hypothetical protein